MPKPKQQRLPGTEDAGIEELQQLALDYADVRDERIQIGKREVDLEAKLLAAMKAHGKQTYEHEGVTVELVVVAETVKVHVAKDDEEGGG